MNYPYQISVNFRTPFHSVRLLETDRRNDVIKTSTLDILAILESQWYGLIIFPNGLGEYIDRDAPDNVEAHGKYILAFP